MTTQYVWLAETVETPPRYAVRSKTLGGPADELTMIAAHGRRFRSRACCENWIQTHADDFDGVALIPHAHGFGS